MRLALGPGGLRAPLDGTTRPGVARSIPWVVALRSTVSFSPCFVRFPSAVSALRSTAGFGPPPAANPSPARNPRHAAPAGPGRAPRSARRYRFTGRRTVDFVGLRAPFHGTLSRLRPLLTCTFFQSRELGQRSGLGLGPLGLVLSGLAGTCPAGLYRSPSSPLYGTVSPCSARPTWAVSALRSTASFGPPLASLLR